MRGMLVFLLALAVSTSFFAATSAPRLIVVISVDQLRGDYLTRFFPYLLPPRDGEGVGGFRFLLSEGAQYSNAHANHYPTYTGPGHSVLLTGRPPSDNGIIGNVWYDREQRRIVYCSEDQ